MASKWTTSEGFNKAVSPPFKIGDVVECTSRYMRGGMKGKFRVEHIWFDSMGEWLVDVRVFVPGGVVRHHNWQATRQSAFWFAKESSELLTQRKAG